MSELDLAIQRLRLREATHQKPSSMFETRVRANSRERRSSFATTKLFSVTTAPVEGDAYSRSDLAMLPGSLEAALRAFESDEVLRASPAYRWTLNHTLRCADPLELFPTHLTTAGA